MESLHQYFTNQRRALSQQVSQLVDQVNNGVQGVGAALLTVHDAQGNLLPQPCAISPTNAIHHVTETGAIATINPPIDTGTGTTSPPMSAFSGPLFLIPDAAWTTVTGGNIVLATVAVVGRVLVMVYDPGAMVWYPSYV